MTRPNTGKNVYLLVIVPKIMNELGKCFGMLYINVAASVLWHTGKNVYLLVNVP